MSRGRIVIYILLLFILISIVAILGALMVGTRIAGDENEVIINVGVGPRVTTNISLETTHPNQTLIPIHAAPSNANEVNFMIIRVPIRWTKPDNQGGSLAGLEVTFELDLSINFTEELLGLVNVLMFYDTVCIEYVGNKVDNFSFTTYNTYRFIDSFTQEFSIEQKMFDLSFGDEKAVYLLVFIAPPVRGQWQADYPKSISLQLGIRALNPNEPSKVEA